MNAIAKLLFNAVLAIVPIGAVVLVFLVAGLLVAIGNGWGDAAEWYGAVLDYVLVLWYAALFCYFLSPKAWRDPDYDKSEVARRR